MDLIVGILIGGLAVGSMYAMATISLSMIWGSMGMLNMAHSAVLTLGAYGSFLAVRHLGLPWWAGILPAIVVGAVCGLAIYTGIVQWLYKRPGFAVNTIVATIAVNALVENFINTGIGPDAQLQPFSFDGAMVLGATTVRMQPVVVFIAACLITVAISLLLSRTKIGLSIRAVSQQREAASLMGVSVSRVYIQIMMIAGMVSAISGMLLTGMTTIYPTVGAAPTVKALVICTVAGLGSLWGSTAVALAFGIVEVAIQYLFGARFGFTGTLLLAICILVWKPYGLFGSATAARV